MPIATKAFVKSQTLKAVFGLICSVALVGCQTGATVKPVQQELTMVKGPPISDIVTPFDAALQCLHGKVPKQIAFGVGAVLDQTGKSQVANGGSGKFVTQGGGDIVQSALFKAGAVVVNRRDPRIQDTESNWGIRDNSKVVPARFYITGSINSLDFLPGAGFDVQVAGVGPKLRQHRVLVGLDLAMTDSVTSKIVANIPLQKQIVATEVGVGVGRFFDSTLVSLDIGGGQREALHFALRQMLNLATFELLSQVLHPDAYTPCRAEFDWTYGTLDNSRSSDKIRDFRQAADAKAEKEAVEQEAARLEAEQQDAVRFEAHGLKAAGKEKEAAPEATDTAVIETPKPAPQRVIIPNTSPAEELKNDLVIYGKKSAKLPLGEQAKVQTKNSDKPMQIAQMATSKTNSLNGDEPVSESADSFKDAPRE